MAEYTPNLNLFRPGTDDNIGIESSLNDNFVAIDTKLGDSLKDAQGTVYTSLGNRLNTSKTALDNAVADVAALKVKGVNALLNNHVFRCISFQGNNSCPPNTLVGYRYSVEQGYWGTWADVQTSSDDVWMCFSDLDVSAKTNGTGTFISKTKAQIKALDCGAKFNANYWTGEQIPDLEDYLLTCRATQSIPVLNIVGAYVDLDIKTLVDLIKKWDIINDSVIVSSQLANLQRVRLYDKTIACGLSVSTHATATLDSIAALGNGFAVYNDDIVTTANLADAETKKVPVVAFMISDTNDRMREMIPLGVRGAITRITPAIRGV